MHAGCCAALTDMLAFFAGEHVGSRRSCSTRPTTAIPLIGVQVVDAKALGRVLHACIHTTVLHRVVALLSQTATSTVHVVVVMSWA